MSNAEIAKYQTNKCTHVYMYGSDGGKKGACAECIKAALDAKDAAHQEEHRKHSHHQEIATLRAQIKTLGMALKALVNASGCRCCNGDADLLVAKDEANGVLATLPEGWDK